MSQVQGEEDWSDRSDMDPPTEKKRTLDRTILKVNHGDSVRRVARSPIVKTTDENT